jgi:hypothetical protein
VERGLASERECSANRAKILTGNEIASEAKRSRRIRNAQNDGQSKKSRAKVGSEVRGEGKGAKAVTGFPNGLGERRQMVEDGVGAER